MTDGLVRALLRNETTAIRTIVTADAVLSRRHGIAVATRAGVVCVSTRAFQLPLLHRAIGFGTLGDASSRALDAILRFYDGLRTPPRVELALGVAPSSAVRLLERAGFRREDGSHRVHVLETAVAPPVPPLHGVRIVVASPQRFGRAVRLGFEVPGTLGGFFERAAAAHVRADRDRAVALVSLVDGEVAGSALLWLSPGVAGLYSASVLPRFRGRGIQTALIAERIRRGLARRRRIFTSQTEGDNASAHNLRDMGFRRLYDTAFFVRA